MEKLGNVTLGKNYAVVNVQQIFNGAYKPKIRHPSWNKESTTLNDLWNSVKGDLLIACKLEQLSIQQYKSKLIFPINDDNNIN